MCINRFRSASSQICKHWTWLPFHNAVYAPSVCQALFRGWRVLWPRMQGHGGNSGSRVTVGHCFRHSCSHLIFRQAGQGRGWVLTTILEARMFVRGGFLPQSARSSYPFSEPDVVWSYIHHPLKWNRKIVCLCVSREKRTVLSPAMSSCHYQCH